MEDIEKYNIAFIDGQNIHFGTTKCNDCAKTKGKKIEEMKKTDCACGFAWKIDLAKFRIYLKENYNIKEAYYVLGYLQEKNDELYQEIQKAGYIVLFKEHTKLLKSKKKGNVDTDIVFEVMKNIIDNQHLDKVMIVSGDGDYKKLVQYLKTKDRFSKILFPNKKFASSLYKELGSEFFDYLENLKSYIS